MDKGAVGQIKRRRVGRIIPSASVFVCTRVSNKKGKDRRQWQVAVALHSDMHTHTKIPKSVNITMQITFVDYSERRPSCRDRKKCSLL